MVPASLVGGCIITVLVALSCNQLSVSCSETLIKYTAAQRNVCVSVGPISRDPRLGASPLLIYQTFAGKSLLLVTVVGQFKVLPSSFCMEKMINENDNKEERAIFVLR